MTVQEAVRQLQEAPLPERIEAIEMLIASLKQEVFRQKPGKADRDSFHIRTFDLGAEIDIDRDEMYAERVLL